MDLAVARERFIFLFEALNGEGGFKPRVTWDDATLVTKDSSGNNVTAVRRVPKTAGPSHLVPHQRESVERYAARCALAVYENHLREACERFTNFIARRKPKRARTESPLVQLMLANADLRGTPLDGFMATLALNLRARGSMLVAIEMPGKDAPASMLDQIQRRAVPYLREIWPENVRSFEIDAETGLFVEFSVECTEMVNGKNAACVLTWFADRWEVKADDRMIRQGTHPFGQCPVLAITETGQPFPCIGKFAQIADLSRGVFNKRSEFDDLQRGQGFSILTLQVPEGTSFDSAKTSATIGIYSMLVYAGQQAPAYVSPDPGQVEMYLKAIDSLERSIKRISMDESASESAQAESGVARRLRFERLNADLAQFASRLQAFERRIWFMFDRGLSTASGVTVEYATDFNLVDTLTELDILASMQATGFPKAVLNEKRKSIAAAEFDGAPDDVKAALERAIDELEQEETPPEDPDSEGTNG